MKRQVWDIAFTSIIVIALFFLLSRRSTETSSTRATASSLSKSTVETTEIPQGLTLPHADLQLYKDPSQGWNAHVNVSAFRLLPVEDPIPEQASGYAYLSVNSGSELRLYSPWAHVPDLGPGKHQIKVSLRDEQFRQFTYGEKAISTTYTAILTQTGFTLTENGNH